EIVISSSSNGFTPAAGDSVEREISRAELSAGRKATAAEAVRVLCRNPRRDEPELDEGMNVQRRSRFNASRSLKHECRRTSRMLEHVAATRTCPEWPNCTCIRQAEPIGLSTRRL